MHASYFFFTNTICLLYYRRAYKAKLSKKQSRVANVTCPPFAVHDADVGPITTSALLEITTKVFPKLASKAQECYILFWISAWPNATNQRRDPRMRSLVIILHCWNNFAGLWQKLKDFSKEDWGRWDKYNNTSWIFRATILFSMLRRLKTNHKNILGKIIVENAFIEELFSFSCSVSAVKSKLHMSSSGKTKPNVQEIIRSQVFFWPLMTLEEKEAYFIDMW